MVASLPACELRQNFPMEWYSLSILRPAVAQSRRLLQVTWSRWEGASWGAYSRPWRLTITVEALVDHYLAKSLCLYLSSRRSTVLPVKAKSSWNKAIAGCRKISVTTSGLGLLARERYDRSACLGQTIILIVNSLWVAQEDWQWVTRRSVAKMVIIRLDAVICGLLQVLVRLYNL